ncbi:hypothetical protein [Paenibacillus monticola]|uniref:Uncharacterized protein n=1 Tax=Paenibacillus monticola TaxID=2666075 RepID=A0A7X2H6U2_9BACL|nr:hypothetical protein [Paenibacillus monticola]MRN54495.1 hypothetical protein [Paenibacillus monticola]
MKHMRTVTILSVLISVLAAVAAGYGLFSGSSGSGDEYTFTTLWGEAVQIYGTGVYSHESVSMAAQAKGQDAVTLLMAIPLLLISLLMTAKGLVKGRLLLAGTLGYFLYTYASYSFLAMFNPLFLVYVMLLSASFFAFILTLLSFDKDRLHTYFKKSFPAKALGSFLLFIAFMILMLWLGKIINPLLSGTVPEGLEHYSTLVIQALDLAIVVPVATVTGILLIRRQPIGYLMAAVVIFKAVTLLTAISAMLVAMVVAGEEVSSAELVIFPVFNVGVIVCMIILLRNVIEPARQ